MKRLRNMLFLLACVLHIADSFAQSNHKELVPGYYVVVAAYAQTKEDVAILYVKKLKAKGLDADYGFDTRRKLFFVYLDYFTDIKTAIQNMLDTRKKGVFTDAWVRVIPGDIPNPETAEKPLVEKPGERPAETTGVSDTLTKSPVDSVVISVRPEDEIKENIPTGPEVFLSVYNATNNRILDGKIKVIDSDMAKLLARLPGNEDVKLPDPQSKSEKLILIADIFGYRKLQHEINCHSPLTDTTSSFVQKVDSVFVIYFDMVRYRKGDIITLYNVYFYNDAAVMMPESKYELGQLLELMQENKDYRIRLHGHTNGNHFGKIISQGPDKNFFSLKNATSSLGSAKVLSKLRAEVIRDWLIASGVDASRVEIKAWGGKRPLYDKNGPGARKNVRVEVEVLSE